MMSSLQIEPLVEQPLQVEKKTGRTKNHALYGIFAGFVIARCELLRMFAAAFRNLRAEVRLEVVAVPRYHNYRSAVEQFAVPCLPEFELNAQTQEHASTGSCIRFRALGLFDCDQSIERKGLRNQLSHRTLRWVRL